MNIWKEILSILLAILLAKWIIYPVAATVDPLITATPMTSYITNNQQMKLPVSFEITVPEAQDTILEGMLPLELAIVLDISGSMQGSPLETAKEGIIQIIQNLRDGDIVHLVTYSESANVVWTNKKLEDKDWMIRQIRKLKTETSTNLFAGVDRGYTVLTEWALEEERTTDRRIFLFSDGMVNMGVTDHNEITQKVGLMFENSRIITSTFGVGTSFDRELMTRIASSGKGDFFFISDPSKMTKVLNIARKDVQSVIGYDAVLHLSTEGLGNSIVEQQFQVSVENVFQKYRMLSKKSQHSISVKDLRAGDTKRYLVELNVDAHLSSELLHDKDLEVAVLKWELSFTEKKKGEKNRKIEGVVNVKLTSDASKQIEHEDKNVEAHYKLAKITQKHSDVLDDFEKDQILKAQEKTKEMKTDTLQLKDFLKQNEAFIKKDYGNALDVQLHRLQESIEQSQEIVSDSQANHGSFQKKVQDAIYSMTAVQVLNSEASSAHDEL